MIDTTYYQKVPRDVKLFPKMLENNQFIVVLQSKIVGLTPFFAYATGSMCYSGLQYAKLISLITMVEHHLGTSITFLWVVWVSQIVCLILSPIALRKTR